MQSTSSRRPFNRRDFVIAAGGTVLASSIGAVRARAQTLPKPAKPIVMSVLDVTGVLQVVQPIFENYKAAHPDMVSDFAFVKAPAPELAGKLQVLEKSGHLDVDLILTGTDGMAAGLQYGLFEELIPKHASYFPDLDQRQLPGANALQKMTKGFGIVNEYYPGGPLLFFMPDVVKNPPKTAQGLLDWAKANPNKFSYPRPSNSGPGRTFVMALPYILGDSAALDPVNGWSKTWAYLKEIGNYIDYYPSGTAQLLTEFAQGTRTLLVTTTGFDINPRALGIVPKEATISTFDNFHWISGCDFYVVPKGLAEDRLAVVLDYIAFGLEAKQQAILFDTGYLYPGPSMKGVTLDMAPAKSQQVIKEFGRPEYADMIANHPVEVPLDAANMVKMFSIWDEQIGSAK